MVQVQTCTPRSFPSTWSWLLPSGHGSPGMLHLPSNHQCHFGILEVENCQNKWVLINLLICRSSDPEAFQQLKDKYGEKIPRVLFYNKGL